MAQFIYKARDKSGKKVTGTTEALSEKTAADRLVALGYLPTEIKKKSLSGSSAQGFSKSKIHPDDLTMFYLQLSNMIDAGVPLLSAIQNMENQIEAPALKQIVKDISRKIEGGESFSSSLKYHKETFSSIDRSMIEVGESSGNIAQIFQHMADLTESKANLEHEIRSALAYPIVLMIASVAVVIFMMVWVIPSFQMIFERAGVPLPLPTRIIYSLGMFIRHHYILVVFAVIALVALLRILLRVPSIKYWWDSTIIRIPMLGHLLIRIEVTRWARNVGIMVGSGIPILDALSISCGLTQNVLFQEIYQLAVNNVQSGNRIAESLAFKKVFPNDVIQMISTGEQSGNLDKMLGKVAVFYDVLVKRSLKKLTSMIEPIFILILGGIIGFIMLSILLPIFDMIKLFNTR